MDQREAHPGSTFLQAPLPDREALLQAEKIYVYISL